MRNQHLRDLTLCIERLAEERDAARADLAAARGLLIEARPFVQDSHGFTHHELRARIDAFLKGDGE